MSGQDNIPDVEARILRIDALCERFEAAWKAWKLGQPRPSLVEYVQQAESAERGESLTELLRIELAYRRRHGEQPQRDEYHERIPQFAAEIDAAFQGSRDAEAQQRRQLQGQRIPIRLKCPHCHNPIAVVDDTPPDEVVCPSCGSSFHLDLDRTLSWSAGSLPPAGKYQLLERVGHGAFGAVYRAHDTELDRMVALKVPHRGTFATEQEEERFLREGRSAAQLKHPGIVPVYEVGRTDAYPYIVSEFVEGVTLAEMLDSATGRRFTFRESVELVALIADALQHAHENRVVHRDVKPSNILLQRVSGGEVRGKDSATDAPTTIHHSPRLMDFGLARRDEREITMTLEGQVLGTPAYMSTEQARGFGHQADGRADLYSLGVILYKLLTGELPFQGTAHMVRHQHIHDEPRPPRQLNNRIPRDLETICLKCMEKEPGKRYAAAQDLSAELRRWLNGQPILARPVSRPERLARWCRRNPAIATLTGAISVVLVLGTVVSSYFAVRANAEATRATAEAAKAITQKNRADTKAGEAAANAAEALAVGERAQKERERADMQTRHALHLLYAAKMNLAGVAWENNRMGMLIDCLATTEPQLGRDDLRGFEWYYWNRLSHSFLHDLKGHTREVMRVVFSADGKQLASAGGWDQTVKLWDATSGQETLTLKGHSRAVSSVAFSPDGKRLASASGDQTVKVWDATSGQETLTLKGHTREVYCVAFSADGKRLASASGDQTVKVWDGTSGQETLTLKGHTGGVYSVAFSPDGKRLASASSDQTVKVWDATSGQETLTLKGHTREVMSVAFSPDGKRLASAGGDVTVKVWDTTSGQVTLMLNGHTREVMSVAFSPDGKRLATASLDGTVKVWDTTSGQETLTLKGHTSGVASVGFSPDGKRLASASWDGTVKVWDATSSQETLTLKGHTGEGNSVAISADGKRLASAGDGTVKVWDATNGQETLTLKGQIAEFSSVAFSADGKRLASACGDRTVKVWDARSGQETLTLRGHTGPVQSVAFSADGKRLASASRDRTVKVWDTTSGQETLTLKGHTGWVTSVAYSADGKRLASASHDGTVKVWDATSGQETLTLRGHTGAVWSVAFGADGQRLASASDDQTLKVWDATSGQETLTLKGHTDVVTSVAISPDGKRLASASWDQTVKVWDATSGQETLTLREHRDAVWSVQFSLDGKRLASASRDGTIKVWDARSWTPELRADQEARSLLASLVTELRSQEALVRAIKQDSMVSEQVRRRALEWAGDFWNGFVSGRTEDFVQQMFARGFFKNEIIDVIAADLSLPEGVRSRALDLARQGQEHPNALNNASWLVVRESHRSAAEYARALLQAETMCRIQPDFGAFLNTLGVAQYRNGKYEAALPTLTRSNEFNARFAGGSIPQDIAFLAMAHYQLGNIEESQKHLGRLRQLLPGDRWKNDPEAQSFLREAEALIEPKPIESQPPAHSTSPPDPPPPPLPETIQ